MTKSALIIFEETDNDEKQKILGTNDDDAYGICGSRLCGGEYGGRAAGTDRTGGRELKAAETEAETPEDGKPEGGETSLADGELSDDWTDMQFMLDGKLYELPTAYHELEADGWNFDLRD